MNANNAWKKFEKTGDISDYLEFCEHRKREEAKLGKKPESKWNNNCRK